MPVPDKIGISICEHCQKACAREVYRISHKFLDGVKSKTLVFCCRDCMIEFFEIKERTEEKIHQAVEREKRELHRRVCPACVRRFAELA